MNCYTADILLPIQLLSLFFACVSAHVVRCRSVVVKLEGVNFVEDSQMNCENEGNRCYVHCGRECREYCAWI